MSDYSLWTALFILEGSSLFLCIRGFGRNKAYTKGRCYYNKGYVYSLFITIVAVYCAVYWEVLPLSVVLPCPDFCTVIWCVLIFRPSWSCDGGLFVRAFWCLRFVCVLPFSALGKWLYIQYNYIWEGVHPSMGQVGILVDSVAIAYVLVEVVLISNCLSFVLL